MNPTEIEFAVRDLVAEPFDAETFPYDLIAILNASKMTVSRLKSGTMNKAKQPGDVLWQNKLFFRPSAVGEDVGATGDALSNDPQTAKHKPRFILVTNGHQVHIRDLKFNETENVEYERLDEKAHFLLPLAGFERRTIVEEHPADISAAKKLKKLYEAILAANPTWSSGHHTHELNLLMTRLLFCFYAEKTGIFEPAKIFTNSLTQYTSEDGSDMAPLLDRLFRIMNVEEKQRLEGTPSIELTLPYVNGSLFEDTVTIPQFGRTARRQLLECGDLDWTTINPDIFGSMIQTIAEPGARGDVGMHYTSRLNIMKVLQPLFLDDLNDAYEKAKDSVARLHTLLARLANIRVFDPACGSGNFLIISYKELRQLEMRALLRLRELAPNNPLRLSSIALQHFFGIDVVDFACETAKLSLWIAEYQMNSEFKELFGAARPTLPLGKISTVINGNALSLDWQSICPHNPEAETYICGNPPYSGSVGQTTDQKADIAKLFASRIKNYKDIDYVACFFLKASEYLSKTPGQSAFVATNSICQGEQVAMIWPLVFALNIEIFFAYPSFIWKNSASYNAWVICIIVGLSRVDAKKTKTLFIGEHTTRVSIIGPYLVPGTSLIIGKASSQISDLPPMAKGNMPSDGGMLILSPNEKDHLISRYPQARDLVRQYLGSEDFINSIERYCLWITDDELSLASSIPEIRRRIEAVRKIRLSGGSQARGAAHTPHRFVFISKRDAAALIVPEVSAERRQYLQIGVLSDRDIASNTVYVIYDPPGHLLALLSSRLFRIWAGTVGGKMRHHTRVSNSLVYNTFSVPSLSVEQKRILAEHSRAILKARAKHPSKTIAWLYNPDTMPQNLLEVHQANDAYLEEYVYGRKFRDDTHRLEHLFSMYAQLKERRSDPSLLSTSAVKVRA